MGGIAKFRRAALPSQFGQEVTRLPGVVTSALRGTQVALAGAFVLAPASLTPAASVPSPLPASARLSIDPALVPSTLAQHARQFAATIAPKQDPAVAAFRAQLAAALTLDDCPIRATMLTGYVGEFAEFKQWDLFISAARFALEAAGKSPDKKQSFELKRALIIEIERAMPIDADQMPPEAVRRYLASMIDSEWPVAMRDPNYMKALQSLKSIVDGWTRVVHALGPQAPADKTAAAQGIVEAELVPAVPVQQSKTPVVRDGGLITVAGTARTMQEWISRRDWKLRLAGMGTASGSIAAGFLVNPIAGLAVAAAAIGLGLYLRTPRSTLGLMLAGHHEITENDLPAYLNFWRDSVYDALENKIAGVNPYEGTFISLEQLLRNCNPTINGKEYHLAPMLNLWGSLTSIEGWAERNMRVITALRIIQDEGYQLKPEDYRQLKRLYIRWSPDVVSSHNFEGNVIWLAQYDNQSVIRWVHTMAKTGYPKAQAVLDKLTAQYGAAYIQTVILAGQ